MRVIQTMFSTSAVALVPKRLSGVAASLAHSCLGLACRRTASTVPGKNSFGVPLPEMLAEGGWEGLWRAKMTPWDTKGTPCPALVALLASPQEPPLPVGEALVPGCGGGADVLALARAGWQVLGVDLAPTAIMRATESLVAEPPDVRARVQLVAADALTPPADGARDLPRAPFALIWDYTLLTALPLDMRPTWAAAMRRLLRPGAAGQLVTCLFPVGAAAAGPPHPIMPADVRALLEAEGFECLEERTLQDGESLAPRAGREVLMRWQLRA